MRRTLLVLLLIICAVGAALPYAPVDFLRAPLERALEHSLGRKVEIGGVSLTLFSGPGFSLDRVTIHEDPRIGIEPFAYANTLDGRMDWLALLRGGLEFSSLHFNDASVNLVKPDGAPWNFQMLVSAGGAAGFPSLKMRGGRINFKFGQTKSVLFFDDTDVDVSPRDRSVDLRFSGVPARTDRSAQNFGHFYVRGSSALSPAGPQLNFRVELEPSAIDSLARLFSPGAATLNGAVSAAALKGAVSLDAQLSGPPSHLEVKGIVQMEGGATARLNYNGALDLVGQTLNLEAAAPLHLRLAARDLLSTPQWDVAAEFTDTPLSGALEATRRLGFPLPEKMAAEGSIEGVVGYGNSQGLSGNLEIRDMALSLPDTPPLKAPTATVFLKGPTALVGPVTVDFGGRETAEVQATYQAGEGGGFELKASTRRVNLDRLRALGLTDVPVLDRVSGGTARGALEYARTAQGAGAWSGDFELQSTQVAVDGLAAPVEIQSAAVSLRPEQVAVTRLRAHAGSVNFSGEYRWDMEGAGPQRFKIQIVSAGAPEIEALFRPTTSRQGGILARTLRLGVPEATPEWLTRRKAEGTLSIQSVSAGDVSIGGSARVVWDGASIRLSSIEGKIGDGTLRGDLRADLSASVPHYNFEGQLEDIPYKGGRLDFEGNAVASGSGLALLSSVRAAGTLRGRAIAFSPDAEFRRAAGKFQFSISPAGPKWKLSEVEVVQGADTLSGDGATQADGKLMLDLASGGRQVRYTASMAAPSPQQ